MKHSRKRWTLWSAICTSGIPWFIFSFFATKRGIQILYCFYYGKPKIIHTISDLKVPFLIAGFLWIFVLIGNFSWIYSTRKIGLFTWMFTYRPEYEVMSYRKQNALYPQVDTEYLSKKPTGLILGKYKGKYVCYPLKKGNILNTIIMGTPGSGKSALLLSTLITQLNNQFFLKENEEPMTFFALDIKPELAIKSTMITGNDNVHVMNPLERDSYGWDVYYQLSPESGDDEILSELDVIARALVDAGKNTKNEFFYESARTIMKAILLYTFRQGMSFMAGMNYLMEESFSAIVLSTLERVKNKPEYLKVGKLLAPYANKRGEAFEGIELAFRQSLEIFATDTVQYFLDENPRKASPLDLEKHISVFFSAPETYITDNAKCLLRLITAQVIQHCSCRPESSHMLTLVIDEAARLGSINWISFLSTSRSRQCATVLAFQSLSQIQTVWSKEEAKTLIELCRIVAVLSCGDSDTAQMLCNWAGEFKEETVSRNIQGTNEGSVSVSAVDKHIMKPSDIMTLQEEDEILLFIKGRYIRVNASGARYFNIPRLKKMSERCVAFNKKTSGYQK